MSQKAKDNFRKLRNRIETEGLYLAVCFQDKYPQLVITDIDPEKNKNAIAACFFLFPFFIPSDDNGTIATPNELTNLRIHSFNGKISGIQDGLYKRITPSLLRGKIKALKKLTRKSK